MLAVVATETSAVTVNLSQGSRRAISRFAMLRLLVGDRRRGRSFPSYFEGTQDTASQRLERPSGRARGSRGVGLVLVPRRSPTAFSSSPRAIRGDYHPRNNGRRILRSASSRCSTWVCGRRGGLCGCHPLAVPLGVCDDRDRHTVPLHRKHSHAPGAGETTTSTFTRRSNL